MGFTRGFITERTNGVRRSFEQGIWFHLWVAAESQCFWPEFRLHFMAHSLGLQRLRGKLGVSMQRTWSDVWVSQSQLWHIEHRTLGTTKSILTSPKALKPPPKLWTVRHISDIQFHCHRFIREGVPVGTKCGQVSMISLGSLLEIVFFYLPFLSSQARRWDTGLHCEWVRGTTWPKCWRDHINKKRSHTLKGPRWRINFGVISNFSCFYEDVQDVYSQTSRCPLWMLGCAVGYKKHFTMNAKRYNKPIT